MSTLTKTSAVKYGDNHPNDINIGYIKQIPTIALAPVVGRDYYFGSLRTTPVAEIISMDKDGFKFKTQNSVYEVKH